MPRHNQGPYLSDDPNAFGAYEIRWTEDGRSKRKSTGTADRRAAQRVYAEFLLALDSEDLTSGAITVAMCVDAYLADKTEVMDSVSQANDFGHLKAHFGSLVVSEIDEDDVRRYRDDRAAGRISWQEGEKLRGGRCAGDATVRGELTMLGTAIRYCVRKKKFKDASGAPLLKAAHVPDYELPPAAAAKDRWLSREEATGFLAACQVHHQGSGEDPARLTRVYRFAAVALYTASRKEPIISLTWARIVLQKDPAKVAEGDYGKINLQEPGRKKTKKRRGWVPIAAELYPILVRAEQERISEWFLDRPTEPAKAFRTSAKLAGLWDEAEQEYTVSPHVLRHTFGTWAAQDGVPLYQIAGIMHDTVATIEKHYLHHTPEHLRAAVNRQMLRAA